MIRGMTDPQFSVRKEGGTVLCDRCLLADRPLARLRGLLGLSELPASQGILLTPTSGVHTCFMRFPIDVVFLGADLTVLGLRKDVRPWRMTGCRGARSVLELRAGTCAQHGIRPGDRLSLADAGGEHAKVLLLVDDGGPGRVIVNGRGSLSAAARTADAIGDLDIPIGLVVMPDERSAESAA
jgi:uncharacterized membrane protein (UPF0127 family)